MSTLNVTNIVIGSGGGVDFSSVADEGGETDEILKVYKKGVWTPSGTNVSSQGGRYIREGDKVTCYGSIQASGGSTAGDIGGLPFTSIASVSSEVGGGTVHFQDESVGESWTTLALAGTKTFRLYLGAIQQQLSIGNAAQFVITYFV